MNWKELFGGAVIGVLFLLLVFYIIPQFAPTHEFEKDSVPEWILSNCTSVYSESDVAYVKGCSRVQVWTFEDKGQQRIWTLRDVTALVAYPTVLVDSFEEVLGANE